MSPLESKLRRLVASLDPVALEALANKGLLRRAQKDLERGVTTSIAGETAAALRIRVAEFEVTLRESGPATATCTCPATAVCQHILTAVLFLQKSSEISNEPPVASLSPTGGEGQGEGASAEQELMALTSEQLEKWASKPAFKAGLKLASQYTPEIVRERAIRIRFPIMNSEVHFIPGGGLDGMIASGRKGDTRPLIVAAVIGFQRAHGKEWDFPADVAVLQASEDAPRSRSEVLESCQALLDETLANGLSRISTAQQQRWATLAVSAIGVSLPRLALFLRGIGDEAALVVARDARSNLERMLGRMAQAHALCTALQSGGDNPRADFVGLYRTRYDEIGHLDLVGVAAWPWRTQSGYEGLTVLFWDPSAKRWNSWTESRPRHQAAEFNPVGRYTQPGPWEGAESPRQVARSNFRLMNARRNANGRLSASSKSRALVTGPADLRSLVAIEDWTQLSQQSNAQTAVGLKETNPLDSIVAVRPAVWGDRLFDTVTQVFTWVLIDSQQHPLLLEIEFEEFTEPCIHFLEQVAPDSLDRGVVIGRLQRTPRGLSLLPYSLHKSNGEIVQPYLDNVKPVTSKVSTASDEEDEPVENEEETDSVTAFSPALGRVLGEADDALLALAEAGLAAVNPLRVETVRQIVPRAERLGLQALSAGLASVVNRPQVRAVLRCAYVTQLHRRAMPLSA